MSALKRIAMNDKPIINNKHQGKTCSHICFAPKTLISTIIVIPLMVCLNLIPSFELFLQIMFLEVLCIIIILVNRIKVMPEGIKRGRQSFEWDEIKTIGIAVTPKGVPHRFYHKVIYISKCEYQKPVHICYRRDGEVKRLREGIEPIFYVFGDDPDNLIIASFNRRLLRHIIAYWGKDIKNLGDVKGRTP